MLDGLAGAADDDPPRKSSPSRLSPGLVDLGCAAGAFGIASRFDAGGSTVLGLAGAAAGSSISSPNKSISCGRARGACGSG